MEAPAGAALGSRPEIVKKIIVLGGKGVVRLPSPAHLLTCRLHDGVLN